MDINNSDRFRCLVAIEQGGFIFEAGKVYFLKTKSDNTVSIYKGCGGVGNFSLSECDDHFVQVIKIKCTKDIKEDGETLHRAGDIFDVATSSDDEYILYAGSDTDPVSTITKATLAIHFEEVA